MGKVPVGATRWRPTLPHVPFFGGLVGVIPPGYPAEEETYRKATRLVPTQRYCGCPSALSILKIRVPSIGPISETGENQGGFPWKKSILFA